MGESRWLKVEGYERMATGLARMIHDGSSRNRRGTWRGPRLDE